VLEAVEQCSYWYEGTRTLCVLYMNAWNVEGKRRGGRGGYL